MTHLKKRELNILIIDDSPEAVIVLQGLLKHLNHTSYSGKNSEEFNEIVSQVQFDLVFMDHILNNDDGSELVKEYKKKYPNLKTQFVCTTAAIYTPRDVCMFLRMGYDDVLPKPFDPKYLKHILSKLK